MNFQPVLHKKANFSTLHFVCRLFRALILAGLFFAPVFGLEKGRCGTLHFSENQTKSIKRTVAKVGCIPENYYGKVDTALTENFIIYYTKEKAHAVRTTAFIDSLKIHLENAYYLFKNNIGLKAISGISRTHHYRGNVPYKPNSVDRYYPVEVIDIGLMRNYEGEDSTVFGLTMSAQKSKASQIIIENDFFYGADCYGAISTNPMMHKNTDYSINWQNALKVTVYHELYHAFQFYYYNINDYNHSFWLEASATGAEEIGAPEVDDYVNYLFNAFNNPGRSMENSTSDQEYGLSTLYLFLHYKLGPKFDSYIWESFSKNPTEKFSVHLAKYILSRAEDPEELFHEYAKRVFFSGSRALEPQAPIFWPDQPNWPSWKISNDRTTTRILPSTSIDFVRTTGPEPKIDSATAKTRLYLENEGLYVWVLSRLLENGYVPPPEPTPLKEFTVYPNPWNPGNSPYLRFKPLPENATGIEIRSSNGSLIDRINGSPGDELIWQPKRLPAPGILYYRTLPKGRNKVLIVEW